LLRAIRRERERTFEQEILDLVDRLRCGGGIVDGRRKVLEAMSARRWIAIADIPNPQQKATSKHYASKVEQAVWVPPSAELVGAASARVQTALRAVRPALTNSSYRQCLRPVGSAVLGGALRGRSPVVFQGNQISGPSSIASHQNGIAGVGRSILKFANRWMVGKGRTPDTAWIEYEAAAWHLAYLLVVAVTAQYNIGSNVFAKSSEHHIAGRRDQSFVVNILAQTGGIISRSAVNGQNACLNRDQSREFGKELALRVGQRRICKPVDGSQVLPPTVAQQTIVIATDRNQRKTLQQV